MCFLTLAILKLTERLAVRVPQKRQLIRIMTWLFFETENINSNPALREQDEFRAFDLTRPDPNELTRPDPI